MEFLIVAIGIFFVAVHALERFNKRQNIRCTTTAFRYYGAAGVYVAAYQAVFLGLIFAPELLKFFPEVLGSFSLSPDEVAAFSFSNQQSDLYRVGTLTICAVAVCKVLSTIPGVSNVDRGAIKVLHRLALIPFEALRFSRELQSLPLQVSEQESQEANKVLAGHGVSETDLRQMEGSPLLSSWIKGYVCLQRIERWRLDHQFAGFFHEREGQYQRLTNAFERLTKLGVGIYNLNNRLDGNMKVEEIREASRRMEDSFQSGLDDFIAECCDFVSQAILSCCYTNGDRLQRIREFGFAYSGRFAAPGFSHDKIVATFLVLLVGMLTIFLGLQSDEMRAHRALLLPVMITLSYVIAMLVALYCRTYFTLCRATADRPLPFSGYLLAALIATGLSAVLQVAFLASFFISDSSLIAALQQSWARFVSGAWVYRIMTFAATMLFAYLLDARLFTRFRPALRGLANGAVLAAGLAFAALLVYAIGKELGRVDRVWTLFDVVLPQWLLQVFIAMTCGTIMGFVVPFLEGGEGARSRPGSDPGLMEAEPEGAAVVHLNSRGRSAG
ncbi:hypothetical protein SAMN05216203_2652 [Marinobacter daqiaonensis]|uniref:Uncharacterized protein n=1 Tax=Marinobacter daqiaonensis TaxID=650891 RepID=A0A1I6J4Q1_9GAMM|nr:hypothetical protein [Marinobacter daqiaonensis]SFR73963.1 hypothetical protein SAMN05216203_2652 [Marinobacter daqiaonensis]